MAVYLDQMLFFFSTIQLKNGDNRHYPIKKLAVKADVNSEIPLKVELSFHPMDVNGKIIKGVRSSSVTLDATDASQRVEIAMEGNIENLDGIIVRAKLCGADGEPIAPSQAINFKNLKIAVDGSYIDEF